MAADFDSAERLFGFARQTVKRSREALEKLDPTEPDTSQWYADRDEAKAAEDAAELKMRALIDAISAKNRGDDV